MDKKEMTTMTSTYNKKSFVLYCDIYESIIDLSPADKAQILDSIFLYSRGETLPKLSDVSKIAFSFIKQSLDRDFKKWENKRNANIENGKLGGRPRNPKNPNKPTGLNGNPKNLVSVNASVSVNANANKQQELDSFLERMGNRAKVEKGIPYVLKGNSWTKVNNIAAYLAKVGEDKSVLSTYQEPKVSVQDVMARLDEQTRRAGL